MDFMHTVLFFVVALGLLITVHEAGHFLVAKRLGVKVLRFSVGFGRPLWRRRHGADDTEYVIAAIPLGGYVKMLDEREGDVPSAERHRAFNRQSLGVRLAVVAAGPIANLLFAVAAYWLMLVVGVSGLKPLVGEVTPGSPAERSGLQPGDQVVQVADRPTPTWEGVVQGVLRAALEGGGATVEVEDDTGRRRVLALDLHGLHVDELAQGAFFDRLGLQPYRPVLPPVVGSVEADGPAQRAGMQSGDLVVEADGRVVSSWDEWVDAVRAHPGKTLAVVVERGGVRVPLALTPASRVDDDGTVYGRIGAGVHVPEALGEGLRALERYGPLAAFPRAVERTWDTTTLTLGMIWKMVLLQVSVENLSGPISIAQYAGQSARVGFSRFLEFLGIVSVSLAVLNLLPIPLLDGGHLLYYLIEFLKGSPVSEQAQLVGQRVGLAVLAGLMGLAFVNDLARLLT